MNTDKSRPFVGKSFLLLWVILSVTAFINFSGKVSYIHWSNLDSLRFMPGKLMRIELMDLGINLLRSLTGVAIFSFACISLGAFVTRPLKLEAILKPTTEFGGLSLLGTAFLAGHGVFSLIFLALAGLYKLTPIHTIVIILIGLFLGLGQLKKIHELSAYENLKFRIALDDKRGRVILWLSIIILFSTLLYSSARLSYDSVAVYFSDAKLTATTGQVQYFTNDSFVVSAFQTAIQFTALMQIFGDQTARMFSWISGILIIIFSLALGEKLGLSNRARLILFAFLLTSTAFLDLLGDGKIDLQSTAPAVAAIYWMTIENHDDTPRSILLLIGIFMGLSIIARPYNAILLGIFAILFYINKFFIRISNGASRYKLLAMTLTWIGMGIIPLGIYHILANWIILGDPLAPLSNALRANTSRWQWAFDPRDIWIIRLLYPFVVTFMNSPQSLGNISPFFIAFLPGIFVRNIRNKIKISKELIDIIVLASIALLAWILLFFTVLEIRYVIFLWIILFMPVAEIVATILENNDLFLQNIVNLSVISLLLFTLYRVVFISLDTYSPLDNQGNPQCYDSRFCEFLRPVNKNAALGDRVLTLNAFRYYLRTDLFACSTKAEEYRILQKLSHKDSTAFWSEVYRQGYKYITYENDYTTRHLQFGITPSPANTPSWIKLEPIYGNTGDLQISYKIHVVDSPIKVESFCQKNSSGIWEVHSISQ